MQRIRRGAVAAAVACLAITLGVGAGGAAGGGPKPTSPPAPTSWIYAADRSTGGTVAVSPDGAVVRQLPACWGDWSAGAAPRRVLRVEDVAGQTFPVWWHQYGIVQRATRSVVVRSEACADPLVLFTAPSGTWIDAPSWTLDGSRIAFYAEQYDDQGIMVRRGVFEGDLDGSCGAGLCHVRLVTGMPLIETYRDAETGLVEYQSSSVGISWSADRRTVVYGRLLDASAATSGVFTADMGAFGSSATSAEVRVPLDQVYRPAFSPVDPDVIAVLVISRRNAMRQNDLAVTTRTGGTYQPITTGASFTGGSIGGYAWSPDGAWLAFNAPNKAGSRDEIWKIRLGAAKATLVLSTANTAFTVTGWR